MITVKEQGMKTKNLPRTTRFGLLVCGHFNKAVDNLLLPN